MLTVVELNSLHLGRWRYAFCLVTWLEVPVTNCASLRNEKAELNRTGLCLPSGTCAWTMWDSRSCITLRFVP